MGFQGHEPTGETSWPIVLIAGAEKSGRSMLAAELTGSDLVGATFWIEYGDHTAEEYGALPDVRYVLADHDGTFDDVCRRATEAVDEPPRDARPNLIVIDNVSALWSTLTAEAQQIARRRRGVDADTEARTTPDVWDIINDRWGGLLEILKGHTGPVILTAHLETTAVVDADGRPTRHSTYKVRCQKWLPYAVDVIVRLVGYRTAQIAGVHSATRDLVPGTVYPPAGFALDAMLRQMGLAGYGPIERPRSAEPTPAPEAALARVSFGPPDRPATRPGTRPGIVTDVLMPDQVARLNALLGRKLGAYGEQRPQAVSEILGKDVGDIRDLAPDDAHAISVQLAGRPDLIPAPKVAAAGIPAPPAAAPPQPAPGGPAEGRATPEPYARSIDVLFSARGVSDPATRLRICSQVLDRPVVSLDRLGRGDCEIVLHYLNTDERPMPLPARPSDPAAGQPPVETTPTETALITTIEDLIGEVASDADVQQIYRTIAEESEAGRIGEPGTRALQDRLAAQSQQLVGVR